MTPEVILERRYQMTKLEAGEVVGWQDLRRICPWAFQLLRNPPTPGVAQEQQSRGPEGSDGQGHGCEGLTGAHREGGRKGGRKSAASVSYRSGTNHPIM